MQVAFYCHFPDLLLAQHTTLLRRIYRKPIDFIEELTTGWSHVLLPFSYGIWNIILIIYFLLLSFGNWDAGMADMILVNSRFTASTFAKTFKHLHARGIRPAVLYPAVNVDQFDKPHSYK